MLRDRVAILFLEVARRSPWCRGTPAHVHWSLLRCPPDGGGGGGGVDGGDNSGDGFSPLRFVSLRRRGERRRTPLRRPTRVLLFHPPTWTPHLESTTSPPGGPDHLPFCTRRTLWSSRRRRNAPPPPRSFLSLAGHCRHGHYHRLLLRLSSTSNGDDPTHPTVARYYHSVLLAIYRPLSTTLPPNGVYRCCLTA